MTLHTCSSYSPNVMSYFLVIWKSTLTSELKQINENMNDLLFKQTDLLFASCSHPIFSQTQIQSS